MVTRRNRVGALEIGAWYPLGSAADYLSGASESNGSDRDETIQHAQSELIGKDIAREAKRNEVSYRPEVLHRQTPG